MVPLILFLGVALLRLLREGGARGAGGRVAAALRGQVPGARKMAAFMAWLGALLATIIAFGHYAGIAIFVFVLTRVLARERLRSALILSLAVTLILFVVFEIGFDIELYRGLTYRYFAGYKVF
jgi:hypothetical protein